MENTGHCFQHVLCAMHIAFDGLETRKDEFKNCETLIEIPHGAFGSRQYVDWYHAAKTIRGTREHKALATFWLYPQTLHRRLIDIGLTGTGLNPAKFLNKFGQFFTEAGCNDFE
ncbi:uncharacterized protein CLUP02_04535 [Colletotrichum lupini]|uniref:Uncharacterized protein n=1 Tax=Colletotrichum lupini TaxID=145971 RepID=A0A9Q8WDE3_9PEZI|nr:uncharacterized protein CLUP02_04535 [Colletotrichum lupini]UQC79056.1 hypothetical protein CLUP02_04535 [Colletotrichum lupini]